MHSYRSAALICVLASSIGLSACNNVATQPEGRDLPNLPADRVLYDVDTFSQAEGVKRARLHADTAYVYELADSMQLHGMNLQMYEDGGALQATVKSEKGWLNTRTQSMTARGNVVVRSLRERKTIETEELFYDPQNHRVWSNVRSVIINPDGSRQTVDSFSADDQFKTITGKGFSGSLSGIKL